MKFREILAHFIIFILYILGINSLEYIQGVPFGYYLIPSSIMLFAALIASRLIHIKFK